MPNVLLCNLHSVFGDDDICKERSEKKHKFHQFHQFQFAKINGQIWSTLVKFSNIWSMVILGDPKKSFQVYNLLKTLTPGAKK